MPIRGSKHSLQCRKYTNFFYSKKKRSNPPVKRVAPVTIYWSCVAMLSYRNDLA